MRPRCAECGKPEHPTEISRLRCQVRVAEQRRAAAQQQLDAARWRLREATRQRGEPRRQADQQKRAQQRQERVQKLAEQQQAEDRRAHLCSIVNKLVAKARSLEQIGQPHEAVACKAKVRELVARHALYLCFKPGLSSPRFSSKPRVEYDMYQTDILNSGAFARRMIAKHEAWLATDPLVAATSGR